jgi:hypothetical protein
MDVVRPGKRTAGRHLPERPCPERLDDESRFELVESHQFHRQRALQKFVAVLFDRMPVDPI